MGGVVESTYFTISTKSRLSLYKDRLKYHAKSGKTALYTEVWKQHYVKTAHGKWLVLTITVMGLRSNTASTRQF